MVVISQLYHKHTFSETRWRQKIRLHQKHPVRGINIWSKPFSMLQRRIGPKRSEAEIRTYEQELNRGYECQLFALPSPIAVSGDLKRIINVSVGAMNFRIYLPFALNEKKHASGSFVEVAIPEGVMSKTQLPFQAMLLLECEPITGYYPMAYGRGGFASTYRQKRVQIPTLLLGSFWIMCASTPTNGG